MSKILALALASAPVLMSNANPIVYVDVPGIERLQCGRALGTGWRRGTQGMVSAHHVTETSDCATSEGAIQMTLYDDSKDISFGRLATQGQAMRIDCGGFKDGETYFALGHARGGPQIRALPALAMSKLAIAFPWDDYATFYTPERFIPGMSGGPVVNERGEVVGIVKGYNSGGPVSYARSLRGTPLCA